MRPPRLRITSSSWSGVMPTRTATPNRKSTTNALSSTRKHKGVVDRTSGRSSPVVSMRSPSNKALTVTRRLLWVNNGSPKNGTARYSGPPNVTQLTQEGSLWVKSGHSPVFRQLVLRFGLEIAGVMALVQLFFRRPAGAVDHSPALDGRALTDFFRPACQVFIFVRLQERARVVVGGAVQYAVAVPRPDRNIGDRIFVAGDELIVRKLPVEHVELAFHLHRKTVDGVFDLHRRIGVEMPKATAKIGR